MANNAVADPALGEHARTDLAGECALVFPEHILCAHLYVCVANKLTNLANGINPLLAST